MSLTNFGPGSLFILLGIFGALLVLPYLVDRLRRRVTVPSLRLWQFSSRQTWQRPRWRVSQPWSLVLQALALILLLLAAAGIQLPGARRPALDHVLVIDVSAWTGASTGQGRLIDEERQAALAYLARLPEQDRVMVVAAAALPLALTSFERDREVLRLAIAGVEPQASGLRLNEALEFAERARRRHGQRPGEIVVISPGYITEPVAPERVPAGTRLISTRTGPIHNAGIKRIAARRLATPGGGWGVLVTLWNHSGQRIQADLLVQLAGAPVASERFELGPWELREKNYTVRTSAAGKLTAELYPRDDLPLDNHAELELPAWHPIRVNVWTRRRPLFEAVFGEHPLIEARYAVGEHEALPRADVTVVDGVPAPAGLSGPVLFLERPQQPARPGTEVNFEPGDLAALAPLEGVRVPVTAIRPLAVGTGDRVVARAGNTAVCVVHWTEGPPARQARLGIDPLAPNLRSQPIAPLLLTGLIQLLAGGGPNQWELATQPPGTILVPLPPGTEARKLRVRDAEGRELPASFKPEGLELFVDRPTTVHVVAGLVERVYSASLPDLPQQRWEPPPSVARGMPVAAPPGHHWNLWPALVMVALGLLVLEWQLFGRRHAGAGEAIRPADGRFLWERE